MIKDYLKQLILRKDLSRSQARELMAIFLDPATTDAQITALLVALLLKGETEEEITGMAEAMHDSFEVLHSCHSKLIDTAGTGGGIETFNVSTTVAFVIAGAGLPVAKHGNYSGVAGTSSAEVLAELGVGIHVDRQLCQRCLEELGIAFLFAPLFHPVMKRVAGIRREIGVRTVFNLLGPITNPASAHYQIIGVFHEGLTEVIAKVLRDLGAEKAWVVHGSDGLDEITITGTTRVTEIDRKEVRTFYLEPEEFGLKPGDGTQMAGGDARYNAAVLKEILEGRRRDAARDVVLVNAAAGLFVAGVASDLKEGMERATESLDSSKALKKLNQLIAITGGAP